MEFLSLSRRRSSARNVLSDEERGETDIFAGYIRISLSIFIEGILNFIGTKFCVLAVKNGKEWLNVYKKKNINSKLYL